MTHRDVSQELAALVFNRFSNFVFSLLLGIVVGIGKDALPVFPLFVRVISQPDKAVQGSAKNWSLGCVNSCPSPRGSLEAGFTQPRDHFLAEPSTRHAFPNINIT